MNSESREQTVCVSGDVTVNTVTAPLYRNYCQQLAALGTDIRVDFSGVGTADSACLSLLAAAWRQSRNGAAVSFSAIPPSVALLAELYDVQDWISS